ncbi:MAG: hypothetical protein AABW75_03080 [Nanoarchaeota archaeon]
MATKIDFRFVFDSNFFKETLKDDFDLQRKLAYITSKASGNKKRQNIISAKSRKFICEMHNLNEITVRIFFNKIEEPEVIENVEDEIIRTIKYAVHLTSEWPFKVIIFTSSDKIKEYQNSEHYKNIKNISFKSNEDAKGFIDYWFMRCRDEKLSSSD